MIQRQVIVTWYTPEEKTPGESAIQHCEEVADTPCFTDEEARCYSEHRQLAEWLKELKAYRNKSEIPTSCGDAISRQAVDDAIYDYSRSCNVDYSQIMEYIEKLPSVTPQRRTGRWVKDEHENGVPYIWVCSNCGTYHRAMYDYCPSCGAKMEVSGCTKNI